MQDKYEHIKSQILRLMNEKNDLGDYADKSTTREIGYLWMQLPLQERYQLFNEHLFQKEQIVGMSIAAYKEDKFLKEREKEEQAELFWKDKCQLCRNRNTVCDLCYFKASKSLINYLLILIAFGVMCGAIYSLVKLYMWFSFMQHAGVATTEIIQLLKSYLGL